MNHEIQINDDITVGPQPSEGEFGQLKFQGYRTIVNFREEGEDEQPITPAHEKDWVVSAEMEYLHLPVSTMTMSPEVVDEFRDKYQYLPKPIYAHCKSGKRAGAMVMMHLACEQGLSGEETLKRAKELGFECDNPQMIEFVKSYVESHSHVS